MSKNFQEDTAILKEKKQKILSFIYSENYIPMKVKNIMAFMQVPEKDKEIFQDIIKSLEKEGKFIITQKQKVAPLDFVNVVYGTYSSTDKGFGFVIKEESPSNLELDKDIFIPAKYTNGALNKDKVFCVVKKNKIKDKKPEGKIIKILEKGKNLIVGTFQKSQNFAFVLPDDKNFSHDIFIPKNKSLGAVDGHKVVVKINKTYTDRRNPEGEIVEILGHINEPGVDILSIIKDFELPIEFPEDVYAQIQKIPDEVLEEEIKNRRDLRNIKMVTIDGEDAKDLDDAISIEMLENGNFNLGVHIADVTHYVKENTPLDKEALNRGTSVYLVDRVIPMLPQKLSNGICSLNAGVDRLALTCFMEIDSFGKVISYEICETVININKRMTYTVVADLLTNKNSEFLNENKDFLEMFKNMELLRNILTDKRIKRGSIEFDLKEIKVILDENRKPIEIKPNTRNIATSAIEEFMLIANETIAEHNFWLELPFIYRSHEEPEIEKIQNLMYFVGKFGYSLKGSLTHSKSLQDLVIKSKNKPEEMIINRVVLRSLKQAKYSHENEGHFGLAAKYYCHFTSPIRRYPDLQIHRIIKASLKNKLNTDKIKALNNKMPSVAKKCSIRERRAEEAERETIQFKKVEFMQEKVGQVFKAVISGVSKNGIFVELPNGIEGKVPLKYLVDDEYFFDENNFEYTGLNSGKIYSLGDLYEVILLRADIFTRTIEFDFYPRNL